jgi:hypothetical protein
MWTIENRPRYDRYKPGYDTGLCACLTFVTSTRSMDTIDNGDG